MFYVLLYIILSFSFFAFAGNNQHKAHSHGAATLSIAFDGFKGKLVFEAPSESIYGFEYIAKTKADLLKQKKALATLKESMSDMVVLENKLNCKFLNQKIEIEQQKNHATVESVFDILCDLDPTGSTIHFNVQKSFPDLKNIQVQVLIGDMQKSIEVKKNGVSVELKK